MSCDCDECLRPYNEMKKALEFYADPENHLQKFAQPITAIPIWKDAGSIARAALEFTK